MLREKIEQYLEMLEIESEGFDKQTAEKRLVAAILSSYIDDLKEVLAENEGLQK